MNGPKPITEVVIGKPTPTIGQMLTMFDEAISTPKYDNEFSSSGGEDANDGLAGLSVPSFAYEIVDDSTVCSDETGNERSYGECWRKASDSCKVCTCYNRNEVRCQPVDCPSRPLCTFGQRLVAETIDGCCKNYRCVDSELFFFSNYLL